MAHIREINKIQKILEKNKSVQENKTYKFDTNQKLKLEDINCDLKIIIKENIKVEITQIIEEKNSINSLNIILEKNSTLILKQLIKATRYYKINTEVNENAQFEQKLIYLIDNQETFIESKAILKEKESRAKMTIKGVAQNGARVVCDGIINIGKKANKAQGSQEIRGLLMDSISNIQNEPILEINNNEVICSHSASIAQVKDDIKFYMQSRGLNKQEIKTIIIEGLLGEIIADE